MPFKINPFTNKPDYYETGGGGGGGITSVVADSGTATPSSGVLDLFAAAVGAGTNPAETVASGDTVTVNVQTSQAVAAADATKIGLCNFDSSTFGVTAEGFVTTLVSFTTITGDSGGPESPSSLGNFNILGSGSITTIGSTNTETISLTGLTNHNVLLGAGTSTITNVPPSATAGIPLVSTGSSADPTFGTVLVVGGGTGIVTATAYAPIIGGTTATSPFQSADGNLSVAGFVLTSNGSSAVPSFQDGSSLGFIKSITGDSGGAESPSGFGNFNILGTGSITTVGSTNTETVQLTGLTNHNVLLGAGTATITNVAPSATSGVPLISQGASADPAFGLAVVAGGGTGVATMTTAYAPVCAGTTATGALQVASTGLSTSGFVLTSTGASSLPSFQAVSDANAVKTITGNSGGAESPSSGNFNILGTGSITVAGTANTETVQLTGLTNHNVLLGAGTATVTNVAPSATSGVPLISNGSAADPSFGVAVVAGGGTGVSTMTTAYAPVCAGTTATGALQVASTGLSTSGFVLTSTGASSTPSFQAIPANIKSIAIQSFTASGTYTPTSGMLYCIAEVVGGGGAGGGSSSTTAGQVAVGGGGGAGGYSRRLLTSAQIGGSQTVTIGAGGTAVSAGTGNTGGTTSLGALLSAAGGVGGQNSGAGTGNTGGTPGAGGAGSTGDVNVNGGTGIIGYGNGTLGGVWPGGGGSSYFGSGGYGNFAGGGVNAVAKGSGGGGSGTGPGGGNTSGGTGAAGIVIITEFVGS